MTRLILAVCLLLLASSPVQSRVAQARIAKVTTAVATMEGVRVRLDWPAQAASGDLQIWAARVDAPDLGYRYRDLHWRCPLHREGQGGWRCEGELRSARAAPPLRLLLQFDAATTHAALVRGPARLALDRSAASPDITRFELAEVPVSWAQALVAVAWPQANLKSGTLDADLTVDAKAGGSLQVTGPMRLRGVGLETDDALVAGENLGGDLRIDYRSTPAGTLVALDGVLRGGEFLAGNTYVALPRSAVQVHVDAAKQAGGGWQLPKVEWLDGDVLRARAALRFDSNGVLQSLEANARSADMSPLKPRYLSGWMGLFGLGEVDLDGAMDLDLHADPSGLRSFAARLHGVGLRDPGERFVFNGLQGDLRYSGGAPVQSALRWDSGKLYGLSFGPSRLPFDSANGALRANGDIVVPMLDGSMTFRELMIRPPQGDAGADIRFALALRNLDFGKLSQALGLPAFQGRLSGDIPKAHYANERIDFDGGLSMQLFDGRVAFSALSLERPFGSAPSLSADIAMDDLDLLRLTEVLGFGSITGRLDGRIAGLRLVDWTPVAFDARFITDEAPGVKQRISQRAIQNISSVGDASFVSSLQGQLIGLFDDFGYRRIGIGCRLANQVCAMSGLHSGGNAFTIVEGAGIPSLTVVGYNRTVDWPTLVERLVAVGKGDVAPVVD